MKNISFSILIVDDSSHSLPLYSKYINKLLGHEVDVASTPAEAWHLANKNLYDIVICDAKMPYKHSNFGGLILADELSLRFGNDGVLVISQFIENTDIISQSINLPFLKKPDNTSIAEWFSDVLDHKINSMHKRQFGFVSMPFNHTEADIILTKYIRVACENANLRILRADEDASNQNIIQKIFSMIREAHFVIFVTTNNNPNVFYEAGYAFALKKEIIMCAPSLTDLPFDVRSNVCLAYGNRESQFKDELESILLNLRRAMICKLIG
ncbi:MAG: hypothetical protein ACD_45C00175G0001 [uncultured bacterium]|nr:MAG: hypothetical protein ACD_45C00175G0001 [uncultured bacterium]